MTEIRIHGRGGQGGVTLAKIVAMSRFLCGKSVQAFGLYAAERSGAPIQAFCRFADEAIQNRNLIYDPDHVVVLDPTLIEMDITAGLKPGGWILLNTPDSPEAYASRFPHNRIATVDATAIARAHKLGTRSVPIVNTALSGAVSRMLGFDFSQMKAALEKLGFGNANLVAAEQAYQSVQLEQATDVQDASEPAGIAARAERSPNPSTKANRTNGSSTNGSSSNGNIVDGGGALPRIRTGQWATEQPHRRQMIPPCNHVCPAGNDVQGFLQALAREQVDEALEILLRTNPFPSVCGRVCPAPCMATCNRIQLDGAVNVRQLERLAGDEGRAAVPIAARRRDQRVAVVGSGPAGMSAAYHLARLGYGVTVHEAGGELGGLLRTGIPEFRLPAGVVDREIDRILALGVQTRTGYRIGRPQLLELARQFDAVLVATGLQEVRGLQLGVGNSDLVWQGIDFLDRVHRGDVQVESEDIIVIGGGNTAMDAARSALRLGARSVRVVYRRTRKQMPAIAEEVEEALDEGVTIDYLAHPLSLQERVASGDGRTLCEVTFRRLELGPPDESGRSAPVEIPGSDFVLSCHRLILALGQSPDMSVFPEGAEVREGNRLLGLLETPVFAIGDLATRDGTVAGAIGSGRRAALRIHEALSGEHLETSRHAAARRDVDQWISDVIRPESMKLHLFERSPRSDGGTIPDEERRATFHEVHLGLSRTDEAKRCLSCGVCNECDICVTYCPEGVLKRVGHDFVFDYSYCKGCGICVTECPRNVIFMSHL